MDECFRLIIPQRFTHPNYALKELTGTHNRTRLAQVTKFTLPNPGIHMIIDLYSAGKLRTLTTNLVKLCY
jgi:hypothetical protein